jgi:uncharacterized membrane protein YfcA
MFIYMRGGHVRIKGHILFFVCVGASSALGAYMSAWVPPLVYKWLIVAIVPVLLFVILKKDLWIKEASGGDLTHINYKALWLAGCVLALCGVAYVVSLCQRIARRTRG